MTSGGEYTLKDLTPTPCHAASVRIRPTVRPLGERRSQCYVMKTIDFERERMADALVLTLSAGCGAGLRGAVARAGCRPLHLGAGGPVASERGIPAGPWTVRGLDLAAKRGFGARRAAGGAGSRATLRRLPRAERTWQRSGRAIEVPASSRLLIRQVQVQVHRGGGAARRRGSPADGPR